MREILAQFARKATIPPAGGLGGRLSMGENHQPRPPIGGGDIVSGEGRDCGKEWPKARSEIAAVVYRGREVRSRVQSPEGRHRWAVRLPILRTSVDWWR